MKRPLLAGLLLVSALCPSPARSFCGFYVAAGDAKLFNHASQVVLVRDQDRTVLTMANDFKGEPKEFAIVVPVPTVLEKGQIHVGDPALIAHIDAYSAPRLVEYYDPDPCPVAVDNLRSSRMLAGAPVMEVQASSRGNREKALGIKIEAQYTVGEYDILILSAKQSGGLETWLTENHYRIPPGASRVLGSYIRQGLKFFVAKVNLAEQQKLGFSALRPIQVAYESARFMLPIRLGMVNADGPQELFVYALTRKGRVETTNYRNVRIPSDVEIPVFVKDEFADFYRALFTEQVRKNDMRVVFTEYAWNMAWCDPCASEPLSNDELKSLGVFWLEEPQAAGRNFRARPVQNDVFITRLHLRYDRDHFPEDLAFQVTADQTNFQGRYVMRHEWTGTADCEGAKRYRSELKERRRQEALHLAELTGWGVDRIRGKMAVNADWTAPRDTRKWWHRIWQK